MYTSWSYLYFIFAFIITISMSIEIGINQNNYFSIRYPINRVSYKKSAIILLSEIVDHNRLQRKSVSVLVALAM